MKGAVIAALHALAAIRRAGAATPEVVLQAVRVRGGRRPRHVRRARARRRLRRRAAARADRPARRLRAGGRADLPRRRPRPLRPRRRAPRGLLGDRPLRPRPPRARRARGRGQRGRRAPADARAGAALPAARRPRQRRRLVEPGARTGSSSKAASACRSAPTSPRPAPRCRRSWTAALDDGEPPCELVWEGGAFAPGETPPTTRGSQTVRGALRDELGASPRSPGVPWGADMRLFTARGIPAVMVGTTGHRARPRGRRVRLARRARRASRGRSSARSCAAAFDPRGGEGLGRHPRVVEAAVAAARSAAGRRARRRPP